MGGLGLVRKGRLNRHGQQFIKNQSRNKAIREVFERNGKTEDGRDQDAKKALSYSVSSCYPLTTGHLSLEMSKRLGLDCHKLPLAQSSNKRKLFHYFLEIVLTICSKKSRRISQFSIEFFFLDFSRIP